MIKYLWVTLLFCSWCSFSMTTAVLIPKPYSEVRKALEQKVFNESGMMPFTWTDVSQPLMNMEHRWLSGTFYYNPLTYSKLQSELSVEQKSLLMQGITSGVLMQEEYDYFAAHIIEANKYSSQNLQKIPFLAQNIEQESFERRKGNIYQYGNIIDMSGMLNKPGMTLFFYSSQKEETNREFDLFSCMTGVVCVFNPHITTTTAPPEPYVDRNLEVKIETYLKDVHALSEKETESSMRFFFDEPQKINTRTRLNTDMENSPIIQLVTHDLPLTANVDDYAFIQPIRGIQTLSHGGLLIALHDTTDIYNITKGKLQKQPVPFSFDSVKVGENDTLVGFGYNNAGVDFIRWSPSNQEKTTIRYSAESVVAPDQWLMTEKNEIFLMQDGEFQTLSVKGDKFVKENIDWNWRLRSDIDDLFKSVAAKLPSSSSSIVQFNDNLFWHKYADAYGVSPVTGKTAAFILTSEDIFFGSRTGHWALSTGDFDDGGQYYVNRVDLLSGKATAKIPTGIIIPAQNRNPCLRLARTAHGRLLALAGEKSVAIWEMNTTQLIARLAIAQDDKVLATAFTRQGDKLWLYMKSNTDRQAARLAQWEVPAEYRDRASASALPDQTLCLADE